MKSTVSAVTASTVPVSYTHLDVYKRQAQGGYCGKIGENLHTVEADDENNTITVDGKTLTTVSYTHLMGVPKHDVVLALEAIIEPVSLYEPVFSDGNYTIYVMDQIGDKNDDTTWLEEIAVKEAIANLSDQMCIRDRSEAVCCT